MVTPRTALKYLAASPLVICWASTTTIAATIPLSVAVPAAVTVPP